MINILFIPGSQSEVLKLCRSPNCAKPHPLKTALTHTVSCVFCIEVHFIKLTLARQETKQTNQHLKTFRIAENACVNGEWQLCNSVVTVGRYRAKSPQIDSQQWTETMWVGKFIDFLVFGLLNCFSILSEGKGTMTLDRIQYKVFLHQNSIFCIFQRR